MFDPLEMIVINKYMLWEEAVRDVLRAVGQSDLLSWRTNDFVKFRVRVTQPKHGATSRL